MFWGLFWEVTFCFVLQQDWFVLFFLIAVMKHHDQCQLKEDAFSWGTAYSFGELVHKYGGSVAEGR